MPLKTKRCFVLFCFLQHKNFSNSVFTSIPHDCVMDATHPMGKVASGKAASSSLLLPLMIR